jgi:hypothetical protein
LKAVQQPKCWTLIMQQLCKEWSYMWIAFFQMVKTKLRYVFRMLETDVYQEGSTCAVKLFYQTALELVCFLPFI